MENTKTQAMTLTTIIILLTLGILAGMLSGFVGVGGGLIIVPALVYFLHYNQWQAQGTSLAVLLLPVGIMAVMHYYKAGHIQIPAALCIGAGFVFGAYFGSKLALNISIGQVKLCFGILMFIMSIKMTSEGYSKWKSEKQEAIKEQNTP
jgi:uncharacterized membrane protein YfcA